MRVGLAEQHVIGLCPERLGRDRAKHRQRALTELGRRAADEHATIGLDLDRDARLEHLLARTGEARAVEKKRHADAAANAFVLGTGLGRAPRMLVESAALERDTQHFFAADAARELLSRRRRIADAQHVATPQLDRMEPERACDAIHLALDREAHLRRAEAPKRAVRHVIRRDRSPADPHVVAAVRAGRVDARARQHDG